MKGLERVLYTAMAHTTGGGAGMSRSSDGHLEVWLSRPGNPGAGANPEQLFAADWSAWSPVVSANSPRMRLLS